MILFPHLFKLVCYVVRTAYASKPIKLVVKYGLKAWPELKIQRSTLGHFAKIVEAKQDCF